MSDESPVSTTPEAPKKKLSADERREIEERRRQREAALVVLRAITKRGVYWPGDD